MPYKYSYLDQSWPLSLHEINSVSTQQREFLLSFSRLPLSVRVWILFEQKYNAKMRDPDFAPSVINFTLDSEYIPENRPIIELDVYRIANTSLEIIAFTDSHLLPKIQDGVYHTLLLVHPSMHVHGRFMMPGVEQTDRRFLFTPFASPRTGVVWELNKEDQPFMVKLSIAGPEHTQMQAGKTDLREEGYISIYKSFSAAEILNKSQKKFMDDILFEEAYIHPKMFTGKLTFGFLLRRIPNDILSGKLCIPFFALPSVSLDSIKIPFLAHCIKKSGLTILEFLEQCIYLPVIQFIMQCADSKLYAHHLHGQNLLIDVNYTIEKTNQIEFLSLGQCIRYRDIADLPFNDESMHSQLRRLRDMSGAQSRTTTKGAHIYAASLFFIRRNLIGIIQSILAWQKAGFLPIVQMLSGNQMIVRYFETLMMVIQSNAGYASAHNKLEQHAELQCCLQEMRIMAQCECELFLGTKQDRMWLKEFLTLLNRELSISYPYTMPPDRKSEFEQYLAYYMDDLKRQIIGLEMMSKTPRPPQVHPSIDSMYPNHHRSFHEQ